MNLDDVLKKKGELDKALKKKLDSFPSLRDAANKINVDVADVSRYMSGQRQWSYDKIIKILRRLENERSQ